MKSYGIGAAVFVVCLITLGICSSTQAENVFYQSSTYTINPDLMSGNAFGWASGENAVATNIQASITYSISSVDQTAHLYTHFSVSGYFGTPTAGNSYYNFLQNTGLHAGSLLQLTQVNWNGEWYEFEDTVMLGILGSAHLFQNQDYTQMSGYFTLNGEGSGAIPVQTFTQVQIFEPGHPDFLPDWRFQMTSEWLVTTPFQQIPGPGALALLGLAGLVEKRRRR